MEINSYILKPGHGTVPLKTYNNFINVKDWMHKMINGDRIPWTLLKRL